MQNRLHGDQFLITVESVIVKRYMKTLANKGFCKKKPDTHFDTHCIKIGVQLWQGMRDSNPRKRSQSPVCYRYTNPLFAVHPKAHILLYADYVVCQEEISLFSSLFYPRRFR